MKGSTLSGLVWLAFAFLPRPAHANEASGAPSSPALVFIPDNLDRPTSTSTRTFFYHRTDGRGAHAFYTPINNIIAGGFSPFGDRRLVAFDFGKGFRNLWSSLENPIRAIERRGVGYFFYSEFLPNPGKDTGQWVPNWTWHLVGGGFRAKALEEYFIAEGAEHPKLYAWLTSYANHLINELIQAERYPPGSVDAIADLLFFDWIGKVIFSFDPVNRFATGVLHLKDWTTQPQINPGTTRMLNVGQLYWVRLHLFGPLSLSALTGELTNTVNGTIGLATGEQLSLGFGFKPHDIIVNKDNFPVADTLRMTVGFYYSREDNPVLVGTYESTLAFARANVVDAHAPRRDDSALTLNLYPGWFSFAGFSPGFTLAVRGTSVFFGISDGGWPVGFDVGPDLFRAPLAL